MTTAEEAAAWEALPEEEHKSVWDETERNFWTTFKRNHDGQHAVAEHEYQRAATETKIELGTLTGRRSQLTETQARLARELANVDAELGRVNDACEEKSERLARLEEEYRKGLQARLETQEKIYKTMRRFFQEKRGDDPNGEGASLEDLDWNLPGVNSILGSRRNSSIDVSRVNGVANHGSLDGASPDGTSVDGIEYQNGDKEGDKIVDIVDADGNVIGPVQRIEPWNQWVEGILELPVRRPVKIRRGRRFNDSHLATIYERTEAKGVKWLSCLIQATGEVQTRRCQSCDKNQGAFDDCIIVGGDLFQKCGNCEWNRQGCHGASGDTIDVEASKERARKQRESDTNGAREVNGSVPETIQAPPARERHRAPLPEPQHILLPERPAAPLPPAPTTTVLPAPNVHIQQIHTPSSVPYLPPILPPLPGMAQVTGPGSIPILAPVPNLGPAPIHVQERTPLPGVAPRSHHSYYSHYQDRVQQSTEVDMSMKEAPPYERRVPQEPEQMPTPHQEYRVTPGFTPANSRSRPPSADQPTPTSLPIEPSPQPGESTTSALSPEEPLEEITSKNLILRDNGVVYTYPACVEGVPLEKIDESHPYWEPNWQNVRSLIEPQLARWREKHQAAIEAGPKQERGGSSKYQIGRQVNRGLKILEFLDEGDISPYQLLGKPFIQSGKGGICSYDTLFRLSESMSELAKFKLDIKPVEWMRHRVWEIMQAEGSSFNLPRTIHDFYHDPKLTALRYKHGFKNIGRPSGMKAGRQSLSSPMTTPKVIKKRKSMHSLTSTPQDSSFVDQSPMAMPLARSVEAAPFSTHLQKRPKFLSAAPGAIHDESPVEGFSDADSWSGAPISNTDWRLYQVKTRLYTSSTQVTQYWSWKGETRCFEHHVLKDLNPVSWGLHKDPIDFHIHLDEIAEIVWNMESLRVQVVMRKEDGVVARKDGEPRGDVMALFKRERTMRRFLAFCGSMDVRMQKESTEELDRRWQGVHSEQLPDENGEPSKDLME